jgi:pyruvate-formate lyase-activating enzyme
MADVVAPLLVVQDEPPVGLLAGTVPLSCDNGPGNRFAVHLQGCNLDCIVCHRPLTMPTRAPLARRVTVAELLAEVRRVAPYVCGVTVTGGEATMQAPFVAALFAALREDPATARLTRFIDSNGCADEATWDLLLPVTDGVLLDLKALDVATHRELTGLGNAQVLASLDRLVAEERLAEVELLVVPGYNDSEDVLRATGDYLAQNAPGIPVRVIGFRPHGVRAAARHIPAPTAEELAAYGQWVAAAVGAALVTVA